MVLSHDETNYDINTSLQRLLKLVPPPQSPMEVDGKLADITFATGEAVLLPSDYVAMTKCYGSGEFQTEGKIRMIVSVHNPFSEAFKPYIAHEHQFLTDFKVQEGAGYSDYEIFPTKPGLLQWGWSEGRKAFFWLTEGDPTSWPIIIMWDFEFLARYDMPLVVFFERLLSGELECRFIGDESKPFRFDPSKVSFKSRPMYTR